VIAIAITPSATRAPHPARRVGDFGREDLAMALPEPEMLQRGAGKHSRSPDGKTRADAGVLSTAQHTVTEAGL